MAETRIERDTMEEMAGHFGPLLGRADKRSLKTITLPIYTSSPSKARLWGVG